MPLSAGDKLGPYEIISLIGAGGMGEVYRARDSKLKREVALKVLPDAFANDPARMVRFQREAEVLASLNHPNIAHLYGLEGNALVMELVEGETLPCPLPIDTAVNYGKQIVEALEYAHERGVVHRDLKPANIKITPEGVVKVLDFGLAKVLDDDPAPSSSVDSPTLTLGHTRAGVILGTAAYMSPEQAVGKAADRRSDIFSFGAVFYEMLAGQRAFIGDSAPEILVAVAKDDPDWSKLPASTPRAVRDVLRRCLVKDRKQRMQAIGEVRIALESPAAAEAPSHAKARPTYLPWALAAMLTIVATVTTWGWLRPRPAGVRPVARLIVEAQVASVPGALSISRDASRIAFAGPAGQIYVRKMDQLDAQPLAGTEGASFIGFSPDGEQISFVSSDRLKKVSIAGGGVQTLADALPRTGPPTQYWGEDHNIYFASEGVLRKIPETGGKAVVIAEPNRGAGEGFIFSPLLLPGGNELLVSVAGRERQAVALNLQTGARKPLLTGAESAQFIPVNPLSTSGYLVYYAYTVGSLMAVPFDAGRLEVRGDPVPILDDVRGGGNPFPPLAVSQTGTLAYVRGAPRQTSMGTMAWVGRNGREQALAAPPRNYKAARLSPTDRNRIAVSITAGSDSSDIWVYDLVRSTLDRITTTGYNVNPLWTADGKRIIYEQNISDPGVMWVPADRSGPPSLLARAEKGRLVPSAVSTDGKLVMGVAAAQGSPIWFLRLPENSVAPANPEFLLRSDFQKTESDLSPDGHWIAYATNDTGRGEVYVTSFPKPGAVITISTEGGRQPRWSRDGRELLYRNRGKTMAVSIRLDPAFSVGQPQQLFEGDSTEFADVAADGRFLIIKREVSPQPPTAQVTVVLNWFEEVKQRIPGR